MRAGSSAETMHGGAPPAGLAPGFDRGFVPEASPQWFLPVSRWLARF